MTEKEPSKLGLADKQTLYHRFKNFLEARKQKNGEVVLTVAEHQQLIDIVRKLYIMSGDESSA